ncbi:unnamed protein product [Cunninghamella blakesleeana]
MSSLTPSSITGKVFIVTGSASGMGFETATKLLKEGALLDRINIEKVDVTDRSAVVSFLQSTKEKFGKIDGIANFAGTAGKKLGHEEIWQTKDTEFDFIININVRGIFNILGEALKPGFLLSGASIVHIGSMFSERGFYKGAVYSASKHASNGLIKSAAMEAAKRGIRVNSVLPGPIDTPMLRANEDSGAEGTAPDVPLGRLGESIEVANVVVFLLSDESKYVTGASWAVDGGANA